MNSTTLLPSNLQISKIGLGCMSLPDNFQESEKILKAAVANGIKFLDTADLYQNGWNEEMLGNAIKDQRKEVVLATKVGNQMRADGSGWDWNPKKEYILQAVEKSLKRLQTDYIDLYQLHGGTIDDPWDETLEAFEILKEQGKIRAFGISSIRPNVIRKVMADSQPATIMMQYSPLDRRPEEEAFPLIESTQTKVLVRGSFVKGMLINKPAEEYLDLSAQKVEEIKKEIVSYGILPEAFLIRFGLSQKAVGALIIGASSVTQVEKMVEGFEKSKAISDDVISEFRQKFTPNYYQQHR
jgi:aryl-alcohol dehydrogenase-like predicted oxidoreductase